METQLKRGRGRVTGSFNRKSLIEMQQILEFVRDFHKQYGVAPTLGEIAVAIGRPEADAGNISTRMIKHLVNEGFLTTVGYSQVRGLAVAKHPPRKRFYP